MQWDGRNSDGVFSCIFSKCTSYLKSILILLFRVKNMSCRHVCTQTHSSMVCTHHILAMGSVMGQFCYCYGPQCRNGSMQHITWGTHAKGLFISYVISVSVCNQGNFEIHKAILLGFCNHGFNTGGGSNSIEALVCYMCCLPRIYNGGPVTHSVYKNCSTPFYCDMFQV